VTASHVWCIWKSLVSYVNLWTQGRIYHGDAGGWAPHLVVSSRPLPPLEKSSTILERSVWPYPFCFSNND
jgi:hypothetical protein